MQRPKNSLPPKNHLMALLIALAYALPFGQHSCAQEPFINAGTIVRVTLYRDQALVTRRIDVPAGNGDREIAVGRLPEQVVAGSLFAEGGEQVQVRGVRVSPTASTESAREDIRSLMSDLQDKQRKQAELEQQIGSLQKQLEYVDSLMNFSAKSAQGDLSRGVLDAEALTRLSEYAMKTQLALDGRRFELSQQLQDLEEERLQIQKRLDLLTRSERTVYEASVVVANVNGGAGEIHLSYLVSGCNWSPQYTIRGEWGVDRFDLRYSAAVQQMSGEDWLDAQLTLSTASPSISAAGPALTPLRVASRSGGPSAQMGYGGSDSFNDPFGDSPSGSQSSVQALQQRSQALQLKKTEVANRFSNAQTDLDNLNRDIALNDVANEFQNMELQADSKQLKTLASDASDEVSSQSYAIAQPVTITSRREQHTVLIIDAKLPGELYHVATPLLSSFAYREADVLNDRPEGLLGGPATVYLDGRFVGRTELPSIAAGQHLTVGFGADQQVRTRRELLEKSDEIQGGNRKLTLRYRLVVANFKKQPVTLRMLDRMPIAMQGSDVSLVYDASSPSLSQDGLYRRVQYPRGILRWDLNIPGEQFGENAFDLEYSYSSEFDRTKRLEVVALGNAGQLQQDLFEVAAPSSGVGGMGGMGGGMGSQVPRP